MISLNSLSAILMIASTAAEVLLLTALRKNGCALMKLVPLLIAFAITPIGFMFCTWRL